MPEKSNQIHPPGNLRLDFALTETYYVSPTQRQMEILKELGTHAVSEDAVQLQPVEESQTADK